MQERPDSSTNFPSEEILDRDMRRFMESLARETPETAPVIQTTLDASDTLIFRDTAPTPTPTPVSIPTVKPPKGLREPENSEDLQKWLRDPEGKNQSTPIDPAIRHELAMGVIPNAGESYGHSATTTPPPSEVVRAESLPNIAFAALNEEKKPSDKRESFVEQKESSAQPDYATSKPNVTEQVASSTLAKARKSKQKPNWAARMRQPSQKRSQTPNSGTRSKKLKSPSIIAHAIACASVLAMVWGPTGMYLTMAPKIYETKWRVILPGEGVQTALRLDDLGEARTSSRSPFSSRNIDPRTTYQEIASSSYVASLAADEVGVNFADFEKPKIKIVPQTGIIEFRLRRTDPTIAREHALAYIEGFNTRVTKLRQNEIDRRTDVTLSNLDELRAQLEKKRAEIRTLRQAGGLVAPQEFGAQVENLAKLDAQLTEGTIELRDLEDKFSALTSALGITPQTASFALTLKGDRLFQTLSKFHADAEAQLTQLRGNLGPRHPDLVAALVQRDQLRRDVIHRSQVLIGRVPEQLGRVMDLTLSAERGSLFSKLVETNAMLEGQRARVQALQQATSTKRANVEKLSTDVSDLAALESEAKVAETLYTSALASADLSKSDPFASYPFYQLLDEPPLPKSPISPRHAEAFAGAGAASLLVILGFAALWLRQRSRIARLKKLS